MSLLRSQPAGNVTPAQTGAHIPPARKHRLSPLLARQTNVLIIWTVLLGLLVVSALISESFTNPRNFPNIMRQSTALMLVALGQTIVLITGGIDLSVGSSISLTVVVMAGLMRPTPESMVATLLVGLLIGLLVGLVNGFLITRFRLASFMVTLATLSIVQGLALQLRQNPQATIPREFSPYFTDEVAGIPIPFLITFGATITIWFCLRFTRLGRHLYAVGSNATAAQLSGIAVRRVRWIAFAACGLMAGAGAVFVAARSRAGDPLIGESFAFDSITAVILGGTALTGGSGSVWGTMAGVFIVTILSNVLNLANVPSNYQYIVKGVLLVGAVMLYRRSNR